MNMENQKYQEMQNNENENITPTTIKTQDGHSKKEHFRSRMKTQLTIANGFSLKQKLRSQQTVDLSMNKLDSPQDEYSFQYEELEKIGEGSHSIVKKCLNKLNNKMYAVKIIRTDDLEIINQAKTEYQIVKELNHDNILKVFEMFVNEKTGYVRLITEYSDAITLKQFIEKSFNKRLTEQISSKITIQILSALSYLHQNKIVHRDIKPSNILIHPESLRVTLIDFGISRFFNDSHELCTPTGTPLYKAPEMIRGDPYNETADCWSLGITLFEMLTGLKPFNYTYRENEMIIKMENQSFTNNQKYKSLSQQAQDLLKQLLNPNLNNRIQPQEGLKHPFVYRNVQENQILSSQDLNIRFSSICELTPPKKDLQNESQNCYSNQNLSCQYSKTSKRLTYSCGKNSHSFTDYLNTLNKQFTPLKNNKNIMNYSPQTMKQHTTSKFDSQKSVLSTISNITLLRQKQIN
ncbi:Serine/Threonine kinase domain protein (macronuclear) [Tetrahymena thermophila SB210]|uniref:mitogen-activated protein kinase kinase n=1 Tax=Tetrahymena thermophila (strain SB210) TaxID=312017 RepID=Q24FD1_TETTS|nr:Serine/Threonine kinase domain protein [Tetrahymena thermophila SB210]EAS06527.2 Serine/Threonine kinase domain protein [Tetrahymena thermophila SB210]|eukprot:XP_001026772.2 Serine/Threonine kinase domain protein [Tetrahymena thermophila SB210]